MAPRPTTQYEAQMKWSPRKIVGQKRAIAELLESNDSLNIEGEDKEEREMKEDEKI